MPSVSRHVAVGLDGEVCLLAFISSRELPHEGVWRIGPNLCQLFLYMYAYGLCTASIYSSKTFLHPAALNGYILWRAVVILSFYHAAETQIAVLLTAKDGRREVVGSCGTLSGQ